MCGVQACEYPNTYFSEYRAYVTLDGKPVAPFAFDASTARVSFSVSSPLSEGLHKLVSYVVDANGRKSVIEMINLLSIRLLLNFYMYYQKMEPNYRLL
jgi:hypothetical protein